MKRKFKRVLIGCIVAAGVTALGYISSLYISENPVVYANATSTVVEGVTEEVTERTTEKTTEKGTDKATEEVTEKATEKITKVSTAETAVKQDSSDKTNSTKKSTNIVKTNQTISLSAGSAEVSIGCSCTVSVLENVAYTTTVNNNNVSIRSNGNNIIIVGENVGNTILTVKSSAGAVSTCSIKVNNNVSFDGCISSSSIPNFNRRDIVGYITCSSVGLYRVPIYYDWSKGVIDSVDIAMGSWTSTVFGQGQGLFVGGHNCYALRNLKYAEIGDTVLIETVYGANYLYRINYANVVSAIAESDGDFYGVSDMYSGQYLQYAFENGNVLGILTCAEGYSYDYRFYVRAYLEKGTALI